MPWTPEEIVKVMQAVTPILTATGVVISSVGTFISGFNAWQIKRTKDHVKEGVAAVEQVHACLAEAREETRTDVQEARSEAVAAKEAATATTETVNRLETNTNNKMDQLLQVSNAASFKAGGDAAGERNRRSTDK